VIEQEPGSGGKEQSEILLVIMSFLISPALGDRRKFVPSRSAPKCKAATCSFTPAHGLKDSWRSAVTGRWVYARIVSTLVLKRYIG
jgi:hypothetical protein